MVIGVKDKDDIQGISTLSVLCMGRVLFDTGLPSVCLKACVTEKHC